MNQQDQLEQHAVQVLVAYERRVRADALRDAADMIEHGMPSATAGQLRRWADELGAAHATTPTGGPDHDGLTGAPLDQGAEGNPVQLDAASLAIIMEYAYLGDHRHGGDCRHELAEGCPLCDSFREGLRVLEQAGHPAPEMDWWSTTEDLPKRDEMAARVKPMVERHCASCACPEMGMGGSGG